MEGKENIREKLEKLLLDGRVQRTVCSSNGSPVSTYVTSMVDPDIVPVLAEYLVDCGVTVLPVQAGDTVYGRFDHIGKDVLECKVVMAKFTQFNDKSLVAMPLTVEFDVINPSDGKLMPYRNDQVGFGCDFGTVVDRVYLTREEAEAAAKRKKGR